MDLNCYEDAVMRNFVLEEDDSGVITGVAIGISGHCYGHADQELRQSFDFPSSQSLAYVLATLTPSSRRTLNQFSPRLGEREERKGPYA